MGLFRRSLFLKLLHSSLFASSDDVARDVGCYHAGGSDQEAQTDQTNVQSLIISDDVSNRLPRIHHLRLRRITGC